MSKSYIYSRTSCQDQNVQQQADVLMEKYKHDFVVMEKFTGTTIERPKFQKLIQKQLKRGDQLIVREVSRIGRNAAEVLAIAEDLKNRDIALVIDNLGMDVTTPAGSMVLTVLAGAAQMEKSLLMERQAIGIARAKKEGRYTGRKPLDRGVIDTAKKMINEGMSKAATAKQLKIGESTLYRYLADG
jgi:DNA invertase Pin-like site-specific DNA recombinase